MSNNKRNKRCTQLMRKASFKGDVTAANTEANESVCVIEIDDTA